MTPRIGALFAGYGGLELASRIVWPDAELAWVSEFDAAPSRILAHHWPTVPNLGDVTRIDWSAVEPVDVMTGGSPCQDLSAAGKRAGMTAGTRSNLWESMREGIAVLRPSLVIWENVRGALSARAASEVEREPGRLGNGQRRPALRALGRVLGDLASLGYDAAWTGIRAADVGAPHGRWRVFVVAWPQGDGSALLPTPAVNDMGAAYTPDEWDEWTARMKAEHANGNGHGASLHIEALRMLPTPSANVGENGGSQHPDKRREGGHQPTIDDVVEHLLPTPRATDGTKGGPNQRGSAGDLMLPSAVALMPTPSAADALGGHERRGGERGGELLLNGMAKAGHLDRFGQYAPAIARWEAVLGRPAPSPTEPTGKGGAQRLSPRFVEWMQGLPDGWVTDVPGITRNHALKALGNGVVPQQAGAAIPWLLDVMARGSRAAA